MKIDAQALFNKVQTALDEANRIDLPEDAEFDVTFTVAEGRYLTELLGRFEVPEMLK